MASNPIDLSKGVLITDGTVVINVFRDTLMRHAPQQEGEEYDGTASGLRFCELVMQELQQRHPRTKISVALLPGDHPMKVDIDLHSNGERFFTDASRLASDIALNQQNKWLTLQGSLDQLSVRRRYNKQTRGEESATTVPS